MSQPATSSSSSSFVLDIPTILSVVFALSLGPLAQLLASILLPKSTNRTIYYLFYWHCYDALTHFLIEGSFLYHCFFSYITVSLPQTTSDFPHPASLPSSSEPEGVFLGHKYRRYGPFYGHGPTARLWQEYAKADRRWGESDFNVISIELLTVGLAGPIAAYICYLLIKIAKTTSPQQKASSSTFASKDLATTTSKLHILLTILATGELYGGFMTFAPEWLSTSPSLDTSNPVYLWLYLVFFNILWVIIPVWVVTWVWGEMGSIYRGEGSSLVKVSREQKKKN